MATLSRGKTFGTTEQVTNVKLHQLVDDGSISDIVQADVASGSGLVVRSSTAPSDTDALWVDTSSSEPVIKVYNGSAWVVGGGMLSGDWLFSSVTTAHTGWTNVSSTYTDKFMRINATPLTTGGSDSHTHGVGSFQVPSHNHTGVTGGPSNTNFLLGGGGTATPDNNHTHTIATQAAAAITGTSASANNVPAFVQAVLFQKDS